MVTMKKKIFLVTILFLRIICLVSGQTVSFKSFEGANESVCVLPNYAKNDLSISHLKDTLHIKGLTAVNSIDILSKCLLMIDYSVRGGSGIRLRRTIILGIGHGVLFQLLHITSLFDEEYIDFSKKPPSTDTPDESSHYAINLNLIEGKNQNYELKVKIHDEKKSKHTPEANYKYNSEVTLSFDTNKHIFYSTSQDISKYFTVFNPQTQKDSKQYIMGTFPVVKLGKREYYYINDGWYEKGGNDNLLKYAYR